MTDVIVRFDLRFGMRSLRCLMAAGMLFSAASEVASENVTLTTYYPAPSGVYTQLISTSDTYLARDSGAVRIGSTAPPIYMLDDSGTLHAAGNAQLDGTLKVNGAAQFGADVTVAGGVRVGNATSCAGANAGTLRWNSTSLSIEVCNGSAWVPINGTAPGSLGGYCVNDGTRRPVFPATACADPCSVRGGSCGADSYVIACASGWTPFEGGAWNPGSVTYTSFSACVKN